VESLGLLLLLGGLAGIVYGFALWRMPKEPPGRALLVLVVAIGVLILGWRLNNPEKRRTECATGQRALEDC
jgi:hypothetical protein